MIPRTLFVISPCRLNIVKISYISEDRYSIEKIPNTPSAKLTSNQDLRLFPRQRTEIFGQILYINDNDYMVMFPNNSVRVPLPAIMDKKISNPEDISPLRTGHVFEIFCPNMTLDNFCFCAFQDRIRKFHKLAVFVLQSICYIHVLNILGITCFTKPLLY